ncbi:NAD(P)-binding domain-containing protein, partial [Bradyrhizobium erythrophlei]|uniref:NAD(P)-binding domain-containing protein n=1 Tax=Bradyrhizobium erythrophlei TaxID=1437360 RepID=UPI0035EC568C
MTSTIGFVGLGKMGLPMARHLAAAGHHVSGFDVAVERIGLAEQQRITGAVSLPELLAASRILFSSLPNDEVLIATVDQVCRHTARGTIYVDASTVSLEASRSAAVRLADAGVAYVR